MNLHKILDLKSWQLFLILLVPSIWSSTPAVDLILGSISGAILGWWLYATGYYGQIRVKEQGLKPMNFKLFRMNIIVVPVVLVAMYTYSFLDSNKDADLVSLVNLPYLLAGVYLLFAYMYILAFCAKTLGTLEYNLEVFYFEWIMNFVLFSIPFVGVWLLQPRMKQLIA